jgi:hypothetical protein
VIVHPDRRSVPSELMRKACSRTWFVAIAAAAAIFSVGGVAAAGRAPRRSTGGSGVLRHIRQARGSQDRVDIQQSYDRSGDPALIANANISGDKARPQWSVCRPPDVTVCEPVNGFAPPAGPTSEFLNPGSTAAGTVFQATLITDGHTYSARTAVWLGQVQATAPPGLSGRPRYATTVSARGATWSGGWSRALASPGAATSEAANVDELNIEACPTRRGTRCVNLTAQAKAGGFSTKPAVIDNWFTGWYLFAFDRRIAQPFLIAEPLYSSPAAIPTVRLDQTVARSAALGPVQGPPAPKVNLLANTAPRGDTLLVARVRCSVACTVRLWVDDHRTGSTARVTLTGEALLGVPRRRLRKGRLNIALEVGAGPQITGHTQLR